MDKIPWYKSNTIRALIIAGVAQLVVFFKLTDALPTEAITANVDKILDLASVLATAWAAYARARQPTPPLSDAAVAKTAALAAKSGGGN